MNKIECSRIASNGRIEIMPRDVLRYPYVFEKSARGKKCFFYRYLQLCPRAVFLKMLPVGATLWVRKTLVLGHVSGFKKNNSIACNRINNFVPEHISPKCPKKGLG